MNKEELISFLKENLRLVDEYVNLWGGDDSIYIKLMLGDEELSSIIVHIPKD